MAKLGALKPLRGTASGLANIVLQEGEIAFDYLPSGAYGDYGIKMGDGSTKYSNLPYLIKRSKENPTPPWQYDTGTNEAALLNNIQHCDQETIGKIYYIQSYMNAGSKYKEGTPTIQQSIPYKVIGINHEGTDNTMDLQAMVTVNYIKWNKNGTYSPYTTSGLYNWVGTTCPGGYSSDIQAKMVNMTERWREGTGAKTGKLLSRNTKCKLLNPLELFGSSSTSYDDSGLGTVSDFTQYNYGQHYSGVFPDSITNDTNRVRYHDKARSDTCYCWTNSYYAYYGAGSAPTFFGVTTNGSCQRIGLNNGYGAVGVAPVLRLQG